MKSAAVRDLAEKMYVQEGRTYKEVGLILDVTEKTAWSWGQPDTGNWEYKRSNYLKMQSTSYEKQYSLLIKVVDLLDNCISAKTEPSRELVSLYTALKDGVKKTKDFEDGLRQAAVADGEKKEGLSQETIDKIESEMKML